MQPCSSKRNAEHQLSAAGLFHFGLQGISCLLHVLLSLLGRLPDLLRLCQRSACEAVFKKVIHRMFTWCITCETNWIPWCHVKVICPLNLKCNRALYKLLKNHLNKLEFSKNSKMQNKHLKTSNNKACASLCTASFSFFKASICSRYSLRVFSASWTAWHSKNREPMRKWENKIPKEFLL